MVIPFIAGVHQRGEFHGVCVQCYGGCFFLISRVKGAAGALHQTVIIDGLVTLFAMVVPVGRCIVYGLGEMITGEIIR